jgi:hypothetical protein
VRWAGHVIHKGEMNLKTEYHSEALVVYGKLKLKLIIEK